MNGISRRRWRRWRASSRAEGRSGSSSSRICLVDQEFVERQGRQVRRRRFTLSFRTLTVRQMRRRLEQAGFEITALLGDYDGGPWDERAEAWIIIATKT